MSNCTNCFNGCTEIVSDRCVKYTGIDVPELGIQTGDTLSSVEQSLTTYLVSVLNGVGVKIDLTGIDICTVVQKYLPICSTCTDISIVDISKALIQAACDLQEQIDGIVLELNILNADYTIGCLTGVTASSNTHAIVQATINTLCSLKVSFDLLVANLPSTYVKLIDLNDLIQQYLDDIGTSSKYYNRMVPYTVVEFYGTIAGNFDSTGKGLDSGAFENIYLCNGNNGTPDKRGVIGVGTTDGSMGGLTLPARTIPGGGNPSYALNTAYGNNTTTLSLGQIPDHTHLATVNITDPGHKHIDGFGGINSTASYSVTAAPVISNINQQSGTGTANHAYTSTEFTGLKGTGAGQNVFVINDHQGGNGAHTNIQPVLPCYYIIYIP
jgi:microcystin-dependent protein